MFIRTMTDFQKNNPWMFIWSMIVFFKSILPGHLFEAWKHDSILKNIISVHIFEACKYFLNIPSGCLFKAWWYFSKNITPGDLFEARMKYFFKYILWVFIWSMMAFFKNKTPGRLFEAWSYFSKTYPLGVYLKHESIFENYIPWALIWSMVLVFFLNTVNSYVRLIESWTIWSQFLKKSKICI